MEKTQGKLSEIFKSIKYTNILPKKKKKNHNIFYYLEKKTINCGYIIYIADKEQNLLKHKLNVDIIVGYITGYIDIEKSEIDNEEILDYILEQLKRKPYKQKILNSLKGSKRIPVAIRQTLRDRSMQRQSSRVRTVLNYEEKEVLMKLETRFIDKELTISFVMVNDNYLGKGIGQFLMILVSHFAQKNYGIEKISLDDDSDNNWNMERNIYIRLGLWYINDEPNPEMEGLTEIVMLNWKKFRTYYTDKTRKKFNGKSFKPYFIK